MQGKADFQVIDTASDLMSHLNVSSLTTDVYLDFKNPIIVKRDNSIRPGFVCDFFFRNWVVENGQVELVFKAEETKLHQEETLRVEQELKASHKFNTRLIVKIVGDEANDYIYQLFHIDRSGNFDLTAPVIFWFNF